MPHSRKNKYYFDHTLTKEVPEQVLYLFRKKYNNKIRQLSKKFIKIMKEGKERKYKEYCSINWFKLWSKEDSESWDWPNYEYSQENLENNIYYKGEWISYDKFKYMYNKYVIKAIDDFCKKPFKTNNKLYWFSNPITKKIYHYWENNSWMRNIRVRDLECRSIFNKITQDLLSLN